LAEASRLGHLFSKSETCVSTISLASHLAFTKRGSCQEDRDQASHCPMNTYVISTAEKLMVSASSSTVQAACPVLLQKF
ncbi:MAG: hypothetical protein ACJ8AG_17945, partial [Ktedonobacteraceae bacterium]